MATRLKTLKDLVQETINRGATSVEEVHKAIARLPFDTLSKIALFERPAESARALQDRSIGAIYEAIRSLKPASEKSPTTCSKRWTIATATATTRRA